MEYSKEAEIAAKKAWERINHASEEKPTVFKSERQFKKFYTELLARLNEKEKLKN
tara:strand:- start:135 stop:299 length:165 start_codon:yes stop_codon:yes gene_type:complete